MPVTIEQLQEFCRKYPVKEPETTKPALGPDAGSYTTEKLEEWLQSCQVPYEEGRVGPGENGRGFWIECPGNTDKGWPDGERHQDASHSLTSGTACWVSNGHPRFECRHAHCNQGARGGKKTWKNLQEFYDPAGATQRRILTGAVTFGSITPTSVTATDLAEIEEVTEDGIPQYPSRVWDGTDYAEFADVCGRGNKIPREFFLEAVKTVMGALMGSNVTVQGEHGLVTGAIPRFYTVLLAEGQGGKGTSIEWALRLFEHQAANGDLLQVSPIWWGSTDPANVPWKRCGCCHATFNSVPGLGKLGTQPRLIQTYGELSSLIGNTGMDASGEGLLAVLRDLYDSPRYHVGATAKRNPFSGTIQHSLLSGTTPELWGGMFAKKQVEGSGLFQRFNLIPAGRIERCSLYDPKLDVLRKTFLDRLERLEEEAIQIYIPKASLRRLDEWFNPLANNSDNTPDDFGRLNVLALRNALHLAFTRDTREIGPREIDDAIALSDYQYAVRLRYKPASGHNDYALIEDEVRRLVRACRKVTLREAKRKLRKYGSKGVEMAVQNLADEVVMMEEAGSEDGRGRKTVWLVWAPQ